MGQSNSTYSRQDIVNTAVTETLMTSSTNCGLSNTTTQDMTFEDIETVGCNVSFSNINQKSNVNLNFSCAQDNSQSQQLNQDFANKLSSAIDAQVKGFALGVQTQNTENISNIRNELITKVDMTNIANCVGNNIQNQRQKYGKLKAVCTDPSQKVEYKDISQEIVSNLATECFQQNKQVSDLSQKLNNTLQADTKSKISGFSLAGLLGLDSIFEQLGAVVGAIVGAIVGLVLLSIISSSVLSVIRMMGAGAAMSVRGGSRLGSGGNSGGNSGGDYSDSG